MVELTVLTGGGHIAELRLLDPTGPSENVLWEAPWLTVDPADERLLELTDAYGSGEAGKFLAGYTGHALCLNYFGAPSAEQAAQGLGIHGEAATQSWNVALGNYGNGTCRWSVHLPIAHLSCERRIRLGDGESVAYVEEMVTNERPTEQLCHWVQHVTFGPPFLTSANCSVAASALRGMTALSDYDPNSSLATPSEFVWPYALSADSQQPPIDLRRPFFREGHGLLACVQMDPRQHIQYMLAVNWETRLAVGYCFRQSDFPWMAIWEENRARQSSPWNAHTQARGMEFGTTPIPLAAGEPFPGKSLFDIPGWCVVPAGETKTARYIIFLAKIPAEIHSIETVEVKQNAIQIRGSDGTACLSVPARGCEVFLSAGG